MKIAILDPTGFVGKVLLEKALAKGYQVKTLVRNPEKLGIFKERVDSIRGDIFQTEKLEETIMEDLVAILERNSIRRFIHIGGAAYDGGVNENWTIGRELLRLCLIFLWEPGLVAKQLEWEVLKKSNLDGH